ncbi:hypothetical protein [Clostridium pasteurianum]|nr:hypothetical protein [Clostridium pasteurianum]
MKIRAKVIEFIENKLNVDFNSLKNSLIYDLGKITSKYNSDISNPILLSERNEFFRTTLLDLIKKQINRVYSEVIELNIKLNIKELLEIKKYIKEQSDGLVTSYLDIRKKFIGAYGHEPSTDFDEQLEKEIKTYIDEEINNLSLKIQIKQDKPEVIYQRKSFYISVAAFIVSIMAIIVSMLKK